MLWLSPMQNWPCTRNSLTKSPRRLRDSCSEHDRLPELKRFSSALLPLTARSTAQSIS